MRKRGKHRRSVRPDAARNVLAAVAVFLLPPVGVLLSWRSSWSNLVKYCMTGAAVAVMLLVVMLLPSAENTVNGGIEMVGRNAEVEIYGPDLPTAMVTGYTLTSYESLLASNEEDSARYVYAATDGSCYHEYECKFAFASSQKLTLYEAYFLGYEPCGRCNPPEYEMPGA